MKVIELKMVNKKYYEGQENELHILHDVCLTVEEGEFVSIVGESGSGKSTIMNSIGALDRPTDGEYFLNGEDISEMDDEELSEIRNAEIGFVFQNSCMLPRTTALENVEVPMMYGGVATKVRRKRAMELLTMVGMAERFDHKSNELSGGQNQRVAIARALANDPSIILADEPTGALDSKTGHLIMDLFHKLHEEQGKTIVLITHSRELASETDRIVTLSDGRIISDEDNKARSKAVRKKNKQAEKEAELSEELEDESEENADSAQRNMRDELRRVIEAEYDIFDDEDE